MSDLMLSGPQNAFGKSKREARQSTMSAPAQIIVFIKKPEFVPPLEIIQEIQIINDSLIGSLMKECDEFFLPPPPKSVYLEYSSNFYVRY